MDPASFDERISLKNGIEARLRAVRSDDKARFQEAFQNLEPESIYTRFFSVKKALTDDERHRITEVDFKDVVGLVVTIGPGDNETIIGAGRYAAFEAPDCVRSAEVSFTVEEDYRDCGIASLLLRRRSNPG